jgi:hypothetical protein
MSGCPCKTGLDIHRCVLRTRDLKLDVPVFDFIYDTLYIYIYLRTPHEHTYAHPTSMSTSERLSRLDLEIHEVSHQEHLAVDEGVTSH